MSEKYGRVHVRDAIGYNERPVVYVRWFDGAFYIGQATNLLRRYHYAQSLEEVIYFEYIDSLVERKKRERELILEFNEYNLPLHNRPWGQGDGRHRFESPAA